ncbi:hypothetical protein PVK06_038205 [Gossypium arboreum]|uniref:RNase H type-1 domain-containing protein n=1 Tax=Gossypium arboreum TaxID=29729 RepID=A0ABR0MZX4_GOSAR|nr:hypothetical protein PVK06_038205 [Gossypium arboreum]
MIILYSANEVKKKKNSRNELKLNTDASVESVSGIVAVGGAARDHQGLFLAWEKGCRRVELETDCLQAVDLLQGYGVSCLAIVNRLRELLNQLWEAQLVHIVRTKNEVADGMPRFASKLQWNRQVFEKPPYSVNDLFCPPHRLAKVREAPEKRNLP